MLKKAPVEEKSITQLQEAMRSGVMTSRAMVEAYRARIKADPAGKANFEFAERERFILSEERTWLRPVVS